MSILKIENLTKEYNGKKILENVNLEITEKSLVAIIGDSGSGKTTLINMIGGIDCEYKGTITNGDYILKKKIDSYYLRKKVSFILQNYGLITDKTIGYNLEIGMKYKKNIDKELLMKKMLKIVKLEKDVDTNVSELSGGEQQRLSISRAILKESDIILADEPTGSLDKNNSSIVFDLLRKLNKTVVIVTHDLELAQMCDTIYKVEEKKIKKIKKDFL